MQDPERLTSETIILKVKVNPMLQTVEQTVTGSLYALTFNLLGVTGKPLNRPVNKRLPPASFASDRLEKDARSAADIERVIPNPVNLQWGQLTGGGLDDGREPGSNEKELNRG